MPKRKIWDTFQEDLHMEIDEDALPTTPPRKLINPHFRVPNDQGVDSAVPHAASKWRSPRQNGLSNFETTWNPVVGSQAGVLSISSSAFMAPPAQFPLADTPDRPHVLQKLKTSHDANEETASPYSGAVGAASALASNHATFGAAHRGKAPEAPQQLHRNLEGAVQGNLMRTTPSPREEKALSGSEDSSLQRQTGCVAKITQDMWYPSDQAQAQARRRAARRSGTNRDDTLPRLSRSPQRAWGATPAGDIFGLAESPQTAASGAREGNVTYAPDASAQGVENQEAFQARAARAASVVGGAEWEKDPSLVTCKGVKYTPEQEQWLLDYCIANYDSKGMRREWSAVRKAFAQRFGQLRETGSLQMKYNNTTVIQFRRVAAYRTQMAKELNEGEDGGIAPGFTAINTTPVNLGNKEGPVVTDDGPTDAEERPSSQTPTAELSGGASSTPGGGKLPRRPYTDEQCAWLVDYVQDNFTTPGRKLTWAVVNSAFTAKFGPCQERSHMSISKKWSDLTKGRRR